jgi:hypothetical protein
MKVSLNEHKSMLLNHIIAQDFSRQPASTEALFLSQAI